MADETKHSHQLPLGVILAGGEGRRLGMGTKALAHVGEKTLLAQVADALRPQTHTLVISTRTERALSVDLGLACVIDAPDMTGPLAGVASAMEWIHRNLPGTETILTCPTDSPFIPHDLGKQLMSAMDPETDIVIASSTEQRHHLTALWRVTIVKDVASAARNIRPIAVHQFQSRFRVREVMWTTAPYDPFFNINTPADLTEAEHIWSIAQSSTAKGGG